MAKAFSILGPPPPSIERYNIAPTQVVPIVVLDSNKKTRVLQNARWGLIPFWAKDESIGNKLINARIETVLEKPSFRWSMQKRRCLVPFSGFYEWKKEPGAKNKTPFYIHLHQNRLHALAGLWDVWKAPDKQTVLSFTIVTEEPNAVVRPIHSRMPVILHADSFNAWLDPGQPADHSFLTTLLRIPADQMTACAVSLLVNNPGNDNPECVEPANV